MIKMLKSRKFKSFLPYLFLAAAVIVIYKVIDQLSFFTGFLGQAWDLITPFVYGFLLAYIINMPFSAIQKILVKTKIRFIIKIKKVLSLIIMLLFSAFILFLVLYLIIPVINRSINHFSSNYALYAQRTEHFIDRINELNLFGLQIDLEGIMQSLQKMLGEINSDSITSSINAILSVSSAIITGALAFVSSIYTIIEKDKILRLIKKLLLLFTTNDVYNAISKYSGKLNSNFKRYIKTQTIDACILGVVTTIGFALLRSPYFLILGLVLGIFNYIPYFGSIFGSVIAVLIVAFTQNITAAFIAAIGLLIIQQIDANIISTKLMSGSFKISPLLVFISVSIGGSLAGIFGMIVAVPIVSALKDIFESVVEYTEMKKSLSNEITIPEKERQTYDGTDQQSYAGRTRQRTARRRRASQRSIRRYRRKGG
ncbi:MAG: AI-2E family transporter [Oscillospiraceae bacterium]|nr:AI-2E family transporter [Oscillospiraceae bacterium]